MRIRENISRVLITGGAGFLGSHLCDRLLDMGCQVICMDNLLTSNADNIAHLWEHEGFRFINYDVTNFIHVEDGLDAVLHFASPASPKDYLEFPLHTLRVGSLGTQTTLGLAKAKQARYLLASTSEVYGDPLVNPQPETYWGNVNSVSPRGVYDEAKRFSEAMTMAYSRYRGLDTRIVRIFNTYGPRMRPDDGRVVSNFVVQAARGTPLTIHGDGTQTRSFCYVDDMVEGIVTLLFKEPDRTVDERTNQDSFLYDFGVSLRRPSIHDPINLGNPEELTVLSLAKMVLELTGSDSSIEHTPLPVDDPRVRRPDIALARSLLGWEPKVGIAEGLARTVDYFSGKLASQVPSHA